MSSQNCTRRGLVFVLGITLFLPTILHARSVVMMSPLSGGQGGSHFVALPKNLRAAIRTITVRSGNYIDSIQLTFRNGKTISRTLRYGGNGGSVHSFNIARGEYITGVYGRSGRFVDSLTIVTSKGRKHSWGGKGGAHKYAFSGSKQDPIIGLWGRSGVYVDAIGVVKYSKLQQQAGKTPAPARGLGQFRPSKDGGGGKADNVGSLAFPDPGAAVTEINQWIDGYNYRLGKIIIALAGSDPGLNDFWRDESNRCKTDRYCLMTYRREAIAYMTGVN